MHQGNDTDDEQTRDEKSDPDEHDRFDHGKRLLNHIDLFFSTLPRMARACQHGR
jgi:hypothetical protein